MKDLRNLSSTFPWLKPHLWFEGRCVIEMLKKFTDKEQKAILKLSRETPYNTADIIVVFKQARSIEVIKWIMNEACRRNINPLSICDEVHRTHG